MSQHKAGKSNLSEEEKQLYRERRSKGLRGQTGHARLFRTVKDDQGNEQRIPIK